MSLSDNHQENGVTSENIPGGKPQQIPEEPKPFEVLTKEQMGCASSAGATDTAPTDGTEKVKAKDGQKKIDDYYEKDKRDGNATSDRNGQSPKRIKPNTEPYKPSVPRNSVQSTFDDDDDDENNFVQQQSGRVTRSSAFAPKLRITFLDSDDDDNVSYSSWARRDIEEYRQNYPTARSNPRITDNYNFYTNKISSHPDGDFIDNIHSKWFGNYRKLEFHHGYIQWLFPLQEKGLNWSAEPLQKHEIEKIQNDKKALKRILKSYELMLDFYGFALIDKKTGELHRLPDGGYKERFRNLNTSSHNYLRITRILKCLGEFEYEYLKFPFLEAILRESITENTLSNCLRSCKDYWIETLRSQDERRAIRKYAKDLLEYRDKQMRPPAAHCAIRPPSTLKKIENMPIAKDTDDESNK